MKFVEVYWTSLEFVVRFLPQDFWTDSAHGRTDSICSFVGLYPNDGKVLSRYLRYSKTSSLFSLAHSITVNTLALASACTPFCIAEQEIFSCYGKRANGTLSTIIIYICFGVAKICCKLIFMAKDVGLQLRQALSLLLGKCSRCILNISPKTGVLIPCLVGSISKIV